MLKETFCRGCAHQPKQRCPSEDLDPGSCKRSIQSSRFSFKAFTHRLGPLVVRQRHLADGDGGTRNRPWPKSGSQPRRNLRPRQREAEPQSGQTKKFSEGSKHHDIVVTDLAAQAGADGSYVHKRLVYHQQAASPASFR